jgi:2-dehydro-3-deoxyphosphogluconate aldolase/(4S)-4-hydroxy-2-oxoglutarate aldolase
MEAEPGAFVRAAIATQRILPVIRATCPDDAIFAGEVLAGCSLTVLEVALTTPDGLLAVKKLSQKGLTVGAGTIRSEENARAAIAAGAAFLVSPGLDEAVFRACERAGVLCIPGALTPTEVHQALTWGARIIKLFPVASVGGARHLQLLKDPFPELVALPTGGVTVGELGDYLRAGAIAVGVGSAIAHLSWLSAKDDEKLTAAANTWLAARDSVDTK